MENNTVALSQAEVDKLLGIQTENASKPIEKKHYPLNPFLSEKQKEELLSVCKSVYKYFKLALREKFGEPKIRKLTVKSMEEQNVDEFFDRLTDNDFIYHAQFGDASAYIKFDSFLFGALSGMNIDTKHKINFFQSEVLEEFVATFLAAGFARQISDECDYDIISLYGQEKTPFQTGKTGVAVTINWNENLRSFGIEKIFLTKELVESFRAVSK
ncbi:hypothetical protein [uncultured Treponema sp.]|uniref:hypothetical protein n=1 Tax=uncultured Treponema sp. TaxID=162155 RepID=UPI0025F4813B|nr:hypothetical protein [uncultured Treponema sp.]